MRGLQAQQRIGAMNEVVSFNTKTFAQDSYGGVLPAITEGAPTTYRAEVEEISAIETTTDKPQDMVIQRIRIKMRSLGDANPEQDQQVVWRGSTYDITNIVFTQRQRFMMIEARFNNVDI